MLLAFYVPRAFRCGCALGIEPMAILWDVLWVHKMSPQESPTKRDVEKHLGLPIPDRIWQYALNHYFVAEASEHPDPVNWLSRQIKCLLKLSSRAQVPLQPMVASGIRRQRRGNAVPTRQQSISEALAAVARQSEDVQRFRESVLNNQLLRFEDVEQWIEQRRQEEVYPHAVLVRLKAGFKLDYGAGHRLDPPLSSLDNDAIEGLAPIQFLEYATPGCPYVQSAPIGRDGTLRALYELSSSLASRFRWQKAQATMFVLTDRTPLVSTESFQAGWGPSTQMPSGAVLPLSCLARITITVDPVMTPRELSQKYAKLRAKLLERKPRFQGEKHLQLAVFGVKHPSLDADAMREWTRGFPRWGYRRLSLFRRDARMARYRLLHYNIVNPAALLADDGPASPASKL